VDLGVANPTDQLVIEGSTPDNNWQKLDATADGTRLMAKPARALRAVRIRNHSKTPLEVTLKSFTIATPPQAASPSTLATDGSTRTFAPLDSKPVGIDINPASTRVALLFSGETSGVKITARGSRGEGPLANLRSGQTLARIPLPPGTQRLSIETTTPVRLHECFPIP
jgi:hypothetical protein